MDNKFLWVFGFIVVIVLAAAGVYAVYSNRIPSSTELVADNSTGKSVKDPEAKIISNKKGIKRFELKAVGGASITGDGSITLKPDLTSLAVRLVTAPELGKDQKYEVYIQLATGSPVLAGEMFFTGTKYEKYLWGGAGKTSWYEARKLIVTMRAPNDSKPGTVVAEALFPAKGEEMSQ